MRYLIPLLIVLACPLMMIFMMRGMHGGHSDTDRADDRPHDRAPRSSVDVARDQRIAELEREVAALRDRAHERGEAGAGRR